MSIHGNAHVEFGMYPFASVAWAWDEIWSAVHQRVPWTPRSLTRSGDVHARWDDPDCLITQVCGGPFATMHRDDMRLIGAFALDISEADGGHYRSVLLSPHDCTLGELMTGDPHAVVNSADSLSGWFSLIAATVGVGNEWPGKITYTSAHLDSLSALAKGQADIASVDAWSLALITAEQPELVAGLDRVALGPRVPVPPITARSDLAPPLVDELREAFHEAVADPATASARTALRIDGFVDNNLDDYLAILPLLPTD
jgi:ABC-type phosphate/phosphonate transport system substrate-binding protein